MATDQTPTQRKQGFHMVGDEKMGPLDPIPPAPVSGGRIGADGPAAQSAANIRSTPGERDHDGLRLYAARHKTGGDWEVVAAAWVREYADHDWEVVEMMPVEEARLAEGAIWGELASERERRERLIDALRACHERLLARTPDLVEPQLDAMSDDEAADHALLHQVIDPALASLDAGESGDQAAGPGTAAAIPSEPDGSVDDGDLRTDAPGSADQRGDASQAAAGEDSAPEPAESARDDEARPASGSNQPATVAPPAADHQGDDDRPVPLTTDWLRGGDPGVLYHVTVVAERARKRGENQWAAALAGVADYLDEHYPAPDREGLADRLAHELARAIGGVTDDMPGVTMSQSQIDTARRYVERLMPLIGAVPSVGEPSEFTEAERRAILYAVEVALATRQEGELPPALHAVHRKLSDAVDGSPGQGDGEDRDADVVGEMSNVIAKLVTERDEACKARDALADKLRRVTEALDESGVGWQVEPPHDRIWRLMVQRDTVQRQRDEALAEVEKQKAYCARAVERVPALEAEIARLRAAKPLTTETLREPPEELLEHVQIASGGMTRTHIQHLLMHCAGWLDSRPSPPVVEYRCSKCRAEKGAHALGEGCSGNCGGTVVKVHVAQPSPPPAGDGEHDDDSGADDRPDAAADAGSAAASIPPAEGDGDERDVLAARINDGIDALASNGELSAEDERVTREWLAEHAPRITRAAYEAGVPSPSVGLTVEVPFEESDRGFKHYERIDGTYGEKVQVYESSAAESQHLWLAIEPADGDPVCVTAHLAADRAARLRDTLDVALRDHYQGSASISDTDEPEPESESKSTTFTVRLGDDETRVLGHLCESGARTRGELALQLVPLAPLGLALRNLAAIGAVKWSPAHQTWAATSAGRELWATRKPVADTDRKGERDGARADQ